VERLDAMKDVAMRNNLIESRKKKTHYDKRTVELSFEEGDRVLCHTPGLLGKFEDAWQGPFNIIKRISTVNYL